MNTVIYIVIAVAAAVVCGYFLYANFRMRRARRKELEEFNSRYSGKPLGENHQRAMVYGAVLARSRGESVLSMIPKERIETYREGMKKSWNIIDEQSAVASINALLQLQKSSGFDEFIRTHETNKELNRIYARISRELDLPEEEVKMVRSTYAWDICRAVNVAKWCFWIGYLTESQFYGCLDRCNEIVARIGKDWTEYTCSFLLGRCIQGFKPEEVLPAAKELLAASMGNPEEKTEDPNLSVYRDIPFK
ncbi:hypothetical protein BHU11_06205 [Tannerella sp. oral taxon 808]|nr:hypothetical protein BHU11_06205 [Tannerella sp. oral taxon 808]